MDRVVLTSSAEMPVNSPVLKMREFEFQVAAMHRENDELRMQLDQKNVEINSLLAEKRRFTIEQEEAERRYMELEDKVIELERLLKSRGIASPQSATPTFSFSPATTSTAYSTTSTSPSSPYNNNNNYNKNSPSMLAHSSPSILPPAHSLSPLASSTGISATVTTPLVSPQPQLRGKEKETKPPVSPTLTSCVGGGDASRLDVSVVPSPTAPVRKNRKKSIISLFSL